MARFFRSPQDLSAWVKRLGAKQAATVLINLPKVGTTHGADIVETSKRIVEASDDNAADVLFGILKAAGVVEDQIKKLEDGIEQVKAANELLSQKIIAKDEHSKMLKQASLLRDPAVYDMPLRVCPKLPWSVGKKLISTYNCRHYCLDGVVMDDDPTRVYCGELLWRRHVADKFSSDFQDRKTGELVGGYLNERFYKFTDAGTPDNKDVPRDGGNPMMLKPGERTRVPREHQWSVERRMQEAREKGSTTDNVIGKKASGWLGKMVSAQVQIHDISTPTEADGYLVKTINGVEFELEWTLRQSPAREEMSEVEFTWPEGSMHMTDPGTSDGDVVNPETGEILIDGATRENLESQWENEVLDAVFSQARSASSSVRVVKADWKGQHWIVNNGQVVAGPFDNEEAASMSGQDDANDVLVTGNTPEEALAKYHEVMNAPVDVGAAEVQGTLESPDGKVASTGCDCKLVEAKKKGKRVNPWAVCHTTVDKAKNPEKYERCVMDVKTKHPVKESAEETAKQVIMAAGRENFIKISSKVVAATLGEEDIIKAFSMSVDLKNSGISNEDAAIKVADATGMPIDKVVSIQAIALKKMAAHVSDAYVVEEDETPTDGKPKVAPKEEAKVAGEELAI